MYKHRSSGGMVDSAREVIRPAMSPFLRPAKPEDQSANNLLDKNVTTKAQSVIIY